MVADAGRPRRLDFRTLTQDDLDNIAQELSKGQRTLASSTPPTSWHRAIEAVEIPHRFSVGSSYGVATVADSDQPRLARDFAQLLTSPASRVLLQAAGFGAPQKTG